MTVLDVAREATRTAPATPSTDVAWDMDANTADQVLNVLSGHLTAIITANDGHLPASHRSLATAVIRLRDNLDTALDAHITEALGCPRLAAHGIQATVNLDGPALLGTLGQEVLSVIVPGDSPAYEASLDALTLIRDAFGQDGFTPEQDLALDVHEPEYMVLIACDSPDHSFHPIPAEDGPATPGAILVTRIDLVRAV
jgi:hypothetical protein